MANKIWVLDDAVVDLIHDGDNHYLKCASGALATTAKGAMSTLPNQQQLAEFLAN